MKGLSLWYGIILFLLVTVVYLFASGRKKNVKQPANDTKGKYKLAAFPDLVLPKKIFTVPNKELSVAAPSIRIAKEKPTVDIEKLRKNNLPVVAEPLPKLDKDTVLIKNTQVVSPKIDRSVALVGTKKVDDDAMVRAAKIEYSKLNKERRMQ